MPEPYRSRRYAWIVPERNTHGERARNVKSVKINGRTGHRTRYSFGHYSVSFERYDYPRIPQTSPRYALQRYNKRYDPGYDLDTLGYGGKSTIATIPKARPCVLPNVFSHSYRYYGTYQVAQSCPYQPQRNIASEQIHWCEWACS